MPCIKCSNGKWKYGQDGECIYTKKKCAEIAQAIHANKDKELKENESKRKSGDSNKKNI